MTARRRVGRHGKRSDAEVISEGSLCQAVEEKLLNVLMN